MSHDDTDPKPHPTDPTRMPQPQADEFAAQADVPAAEPVDDDGDVTFDMPPPSGDPGSFTIGAPLAELADLPDLAAFLPSSDPGSASGIPPVPVESLTPLVDPPVIPEDEFVPVADAAPAADPASSTTLAAHLDPPSGTNLTADSATRLADLADIFPEAEPASEVGTEEHVPLAEASDSGVMTNLDPFAPVLPASGWLDPPSEVLPAAAFVVDELPEATPASGVGGEAPPASGASDIFAAGPAAMAASADQSDVIVATAYTPGKAVPAPLPAPNRPSDVALSFDNPPGGSTISDPSALDELPEADELGAGSDAILAAEAFDSARLIDTPDLPGGRADLDFRDEDADLGTAPPVLPDASSILAELSGEVRMPLTEGSAVRLDAPGMDRTLSDEPLPEGFEASYELTAADEPFPAAGGQPADAFEPVTDDEVDLSEAGLVDPISEDTAERAARAAGNSSIFSGMAKAGGPVGGSADVPITEPDVIDAAEFSDHPDLAAADSGTFHRPADEGMIDWNAVDDADATMGIGSAGVPASLFTGPASGILSRGGSPPADDSLDAELAADPSAEAAPVVPLKPAKAAKPAARPPKGKPTAPVSEEKADPSVVVDWMADSSTDKPPLPESKARPVRSRERTPAREPADSSEVTRLASAVPPPRRGLDRVLGLVAGVIVGVGAAAGLYFAGVVPGANKPATNTTANPNPNTPADGAQPGGPAATAPPGVSPLAHLDPARGKLLSAYQAAGGTPTDDDLKQARADLEAVAANPADEKAAVQASMNLALSYELSGDRAKARDLYAQGKAKFAKNPQAVEAFDTALQRLEATAGDGKTGRLAPADGEQLILATTFLLVGSPGQDDKNPAQPLPPEAGPAFWKAVNAAAKGDYDTAIKRIGEAKKAHQERAKALVGQGLNPTSDPLEQIFPKCCDDLRTYWEFQKTTYPKLIAAEKDLMAERKLAAALKVDLATLKAAEAEARKELKTEKDNTAKLEKDIKAEKDNTAKLEKDIKAEKDNTAKLEKDIKAEKDNTAKLEKDIKAEKDNTAKLEKDIKAEKDAVVKLEKDLQAEKDAAAKLAKELKAEKLTSTGLADKLKAAEADAAGLAAKLKDAEKARADAQATVDSIAKELQAAKVLPAKYDNPAVLAAVKDAAKLATNNPDVAALAERARKAEADAKTAAADAKAARDELAKATTKYNADAKAIKDAHAAELKKAADDRAAAEKAIKDGYTAELKKATDAHAAELKKATDAAGIDKLKEAHALELKKLGDKYAIDKKALEDAQAVAAKKLKDEQAAELKKQADDHARQVKGFEQQVADEKARTAALAKKFETDLGSATSPGATLDLWLTILTGLRRPADSEPAIAAANKVLAVAPAGTEDAAKAQTVYGMALLVKGDWAGAKPWFTQAKSGSAYLAATGKANWARVADAGLQAIENPLSEFRHPIDGPKKDPAVSAKYLDAGITAYRAGRFVEAEKALTQAVWHDDTSPVGWYFLGATRWQLGEPEKAKADFRQGAERERTRIVPARTIDVAIGPIQGPPRDALTDTRR